MAIRVIKGGLATTVQDAGREGYYDVGIPPSGALDQYSLAAANLLVGNDEGAAALEIPFMGPELEFDADAIVAVTGADMEPRVDGEPRPAWEAFGVQAGQALSFGHIRAGSRAYLAVSGAIDVPAVLGSRSTYALGALGGHEGRPLQPGDRLAVGAGDGRVGPAVPEELRGVPGTEVEVRVVLGLYDHRLSKEGLETFLGTEWTLTPVADRIGFRYKGGKLDLIEREQPFGAGSDPSNIVDAPYPIGSVQIPGAVEPIILHRDAVSGGGYAMVATVISADMDLVAQCSPGCRTRFVPVELDAALSARGDRAARLERLRKALRG